MPESPPSTVNGHGNEYAVIDLGSNSFHLHIVRVIDGEWRYIDRYREVVGLADGLLPDGTIVAEKQEEALKVLRRYGERIAGFKVENVRAAGTSAFRHARRASPFVREVENALGFSIDVLSGREEARLIYLGIVSEDPPREKKRFVIDIGGGSTELIYGEGRRPVSIDSVELGNISLTRNVFEGRELTAELFETTVADVSDVLRATSVHKYRHLFQVVLGASGTMRLTAALLRESGEGDGSIGRETLQSLVKKVIVKGKRKLFEKLDVPEMRVNTYPGALALLRAIMETFELERIVVARAGVRQGLLHDMLLLPRGGDRRRNALNRLMERHRVDRLQRDRVFDFAIRHLSDLQPAMNHEEPEAERLLAWAADLHEIGLTVNYSGYHKHSAYLIKNSNLPGFTRSEQGKIAFLVLNHRRRIKLDQLDPGDAVPLPLLFLFRMAWLLNRTRADVEDPVICLDAEDKNFAVRLKPGWLHDHPLAARQLAREQERWAQTGVMLKLGS